MENSQDAEIGNFGENRPICTRDFSERIERLEAIIETAFGKLPDGPTLPVRPNLIEIIEATARASGYSPDQLIARARRNEQALTRWRTIAMVVCRGKSHASYRDIGLAFGGRELTTIRDLIENSDKYSDLALLARLIENEL